MRLVATSLMVLWEAPDERILATKHALKIIMKFYTSAAQVMLSRNKKVNLLRPEQNIDMQI